MNNISVNVNFDIILTQNPPVGLIEMNEMNELFEVLYYSVCWIPNVGPNE